MRKLWSTGRLLPALTLLRGSRADLRHVHGWPFDVRTGVHDDGCVLPRRILRRTRQARRCGHHRPDRTRLRMGNGRSLTFVAVPRAHHEDARHEYEGEHDGDCLAFPPAFVLLVRLQHPICEVRTKLHRRFARLGARQKFVGHG